MCIRDSDHIVGSYVDAADLTHGFVLTNPSHHSSWQSVDDPNGVGTTVINGINRDGHLVGFYVDGAGNTGASGVSVPLDPWLLRCCGQEGGDHGLGDEAAV